MAGNAWDERRGWRVPRPGGCCHGGSDDLRLRCSCPGATPDAQHGTAGISWACKMFTQA